MTPLPSLGFIFSRACPEVCGRKCKKRVRVCQGPYEVACSDGKPEELSTCAALNVTSTTAAPDSSTNDNVEGEGTDDEYSMNMDEYEYDENSEKDDTKDNEEEDDKENGESGNEEDNVDEEKSQNLSNMHNSMKDRGVRKRRLRKLRKDTQ